MVVLTTPALVADELRIVGRKLTRAQEDEAASMSENVRILDESMYRARVVEEQVDKLTGVGFGGSRAKDG